MRVVWCQARSVACEIHCFLFDVVLTLNLPFRAPGRGGQLCFMCCCVETVYHRIIPYTSKDGRKNIFSDDITFK